MKRRFVTERKSTLAKHWKYHWKKRKGKEERKKEKGNALQFTSNTMDVLPLPPPHVIFKLHLLGERLPGRKRHQGNSRGLVWFGLGFFFTPLR